MKKKPTNNRKKSMLGILLVLAAVIGLAYYVEDSGSPDTTNKPRYTVERSGASTIVDFTDLSYKLHNAVDAILAKAKVSVKDKTEAPKEVPRQHVEGKFRWHARQVFVEADMTAEKLTEILKSGLKDSRGEVLDVKLEKGTVIEIGVRETIEGDTVTIVTDRIYFNSSSAAKPEEQANKLSKAPTTGGKAKMAIVVDDFGYSQEPIGMYLSINRPLTFAVLPYRPFSNEAASRGLAAGVEIILHLPIEPMSGSEQSEERTVTSGMSDADIQSMVQKAIRSVPGIVGVNNHQGSRGTSDKRVMKLVLGTIKNNDLFFVDSRTSAKSVAMDTARQMGVPTTENDLFLDNSSEVSAIKNQLRQAIDITLKHGSATFICHARPHSAQALKEMIPEIEAKGIRLVFVSELLK